MRNAARRERTKPAAADSSRVEDLNSHEPSVLVRNREIDRDSTIEVSVVLPCLNEVESVGACVRQALEVMQEAGIRGEVIVCDNGSTDGSGEAARAAGAHVVVETRPGYGSAYLRAFIETRGRYIVMADADGTYDFRLIPQFIQPLREGYDMVMGSRTQGQISSGAMPFLHRYVGVPILTGMLNVFAGGSVSDAHCGMRSFTRDAVRRMNLHTTGMEFASEMIVKAVRADLKIAEVPIPYYPRVGESKLRTFHDGWRHLRFLLLESPTFLYVMPGGLMMVLGILMMAALTPGRLDVGRLSFDFHYMIVGALISVLGWQALTLGVFAKVYAVVEGVAPSDRLASRIIQGFSLEKTVLLSLTVAATGLGLLGWVLLSWINQGFGFAENTAFLRPALLGATLVVLGLGSAFSAFFISALLVERRVTVNPAVPAR